MSRHKIQLSFLILVFALFVLATLPIQPFWHASIAVEQTTTALNHAKYGLLPFSDPQNSYSHLPPGYSWLVFLAISMTGWLQAGRIVSFVALVATLLLVYDITKRCYTNDLLAILATFFLVTSPLFILLGGAINQESGVLLFSSLAVWFYLWGYDADRNKLGGILAGVTLSMATLCKQSGFFAVIPILGHVLFQRRRRFSLTWMSVLLTSMPIATAVSWLYVLRKFRWNDNQSEGLWSALQQSNLWKRSILNLDSRIETIGILGITKAITIQFLFRLPGSTLFFAFVTLFRFNPSTDLVPLLWACGGLTYYLLFLQGSVGHDHYLAVSLPGMAMLAARGTHEFVAYTKSRLPNLMIQSRHIYAVIIGSVTLAIAASLMYSSIYFYDRYTKARDLSQVIGQEVTPEKRVGLIGSELFFFLQPLVDQVTFVPGHRDADLNADPKWDYVVIQDQQFGANRMCSQEWDYYIVKAQQLNYCFLQKRDTLP